MVGGLRAMNAKQLAPNCAEAIKMLRVLLSQCSYADLDISEEEDVATLLARRQVAEASLQRLEIELGLRKAPVKKKAVAKRKKRAPPRK
jgi:hypothetical protein